MQISMAAARNQIPRSLLPHPLYEHSPSYSLHHNATPTADHLDTCYWKLSYTWTEDRLTRSNHTCISYYPCSISLSQWTRNGDLMADLFREFCEQNSRIPTTNTLSTVALNFSAALDDIFNLGTSGELAMTVEQKYGPRTSTHRTQR